jgi:hypothetical protein
MWVFDMTSLSIVKTPELVIDTSPDMAVEVATPDELYITILPASLSTSLLRGTESSVRDEPATAPEENIAEGIVTSTQPEPLNVQVLPALT